MAKRGNDPVQSALEKLFKYSEQAWLEYDTATRRVIEDEIRRYKRLTWSQIADRLKRRLNDTAAEYAALLTADDDYVKAFQQDLFLPPPNTPLGQTVAVATALAAEQYGILTPQADFIASQELVAATDAIHSMMAKDHEQFFKDFRKLTEKIPDRNLGEKFSIYEDVIETLMNDYGYTSMGLATTVMQGTYMGTYRGYGAQVAAETGAEFALYTGPSPAEGRRGHEFCQRHYGETHSIQEWYEIGLATDQLQEIARDRGDEFTIDTLLRWGGGYGCKHHFRFMSAAEVEA